jgi:hypothetical protein
MVDAQYIISATCTYDFCCMVHLQLARTGYHTSQSSQTIPLLSQVNKKPKILVTNLLSHKQAKPSYVGKTAT